jgi:hypothetical protein
MATVRRAVRATYRHPHLVFTVASFKRSGHYFDLENLAKPVLDFVAPDAEAVWVSMQLGTSEGMEIEQCAPPPPSQYDLSFRIAAPPAQSSASRPAHPELLSVPCPLGSDEALGLELAFDSPTTPVSNFDFTGPIKALIDDLEPVLGSYHQKGRDYRIHELRIIRGQRPSSRGMAVTFWYLVEQQATTPPVGPASRMSKATAAIPVHSPMRDTSTLDERKVQEGAAHEFVDDDYGYLNWLLHHSQGFVLNTLRGKTPSYMYLHRATCKKISEYNKSAQPGGFTERDYIKVCAHDVASLQAWVRQHGRPDGTFSNKCSLCRP